MNELKMCPEDVQLANEQVYSRHHIDKYIRMEIEENPDMDVVREQCLSNLTQWMSEDYFPSKDARIEQLQELNLPDIILDLLVGISYCVVEDTFSSIAAQMATRLGFDDRKDAITTVSELITVMSFTGIFEIYRDGEHKQIMIVSNIPLSNRLKSFAAQTSFLPPMVTEPLPITSNYGGGYLTVKTSVILGRAHHDDPISLDVLNKFNRTRLKIDRDFIKSCEELPNSELDTPKKVQAWQQQLEESVEFYGLISEQASSCYLVHAFDKRGRVYCRGYHINSQGAPFKKALIELATEEVIAVPKEYQL